VILVVGRGEHFALVDKIDTQGFQDACFHKVADAAFGHHGDAHRSLYSFNHLGIGHSRNSAVGTDIRGNPFQSHNGGGAGILGDFGLVGGHHIHDDAAFEHFSQSDFRSPSGTLTSRPCFLFAHDLYPPGRIC
jgi:hypothetical protein